MKTMKPANMTEARELAPEHIVDAPKSETRRVTARRTTTGLPGTLSAIEHFAPAIRAARIAYSHIPVPILAATVWTQVDVRDEASWSAAFEREDGPKIIALAAMALAYRSGDRTMGPGYEAARVRDDACNEDVVDESGAPLPGLTPRVFGTICWIQLLAMVVNEDDPMPEIHQAMLLDIAPTFAAPYAAESA